MRQDANSRIAIAITGCLVVAGFVQGQSTVDATYTFSSSIDGFTWPAHQIATQQYSSTTGQPTGLAGDQANTPDGAAFNNFTGNPAYFNSNNLLTRPAALINNHAWWTDVKSRSFIGSNGNTFQASSWLIGTNNPNNYTSLFGFDVAIASVSGPVATQLPIVVHDNLGLTQFVWIDLAQGNEYTEEIGNFFTLNSPHVGYEARVRLPIDVMQGIAEGEPGYDPDNYGLQGVTILLEDYVTLGGTTQFAIDNFVAGTGVAAEPDVEPVVFQNIQPVGPNTPAYVTFASGTNDESNTYVDVNSLPPDSGVDLSVNFTDDNGSSSMGVSFPGDDLPDEGWSMEVLNMPGSHSIDPNSSSHLGTLEITPSDTWDTATVTIHTNASADSMSAEAFTDQTIFPNYDPDASNPETMAHELVHIVQQSSGRRFGPEESFGDHYANFTFDQYLDYVGSPIVGDSGYSLVPLLDEVNAIIGYDIDAWVVGLNSGSISLFYNSSAIPEPGALTLLSAMSALAMRRRR